LICALFWASAAAAAPYAAMVTDARTGEVLFSRNADTRLHPASLTKMMTLYITFEAIKNGELTLDTYTTISKRAAAEPPSKLGLKAGQKIKIRYLIRAAAVKSANDAATALGEAVAGSEAKFARRMNKTAKALGMTRTTFKNAHGLTEKGHMSTARDMTTLGRHLFFDHPEYYNLFSRMQTRAGGKTVRNTNRKFLSAYKGADGIKTGYTQAAGFNLVASAQRGQKRIIATVFGGRSTATRNAKVAELLDLGFKRAKAKVAIRPPSLPAYTKPKTTPRGAVAASPRPKPRETLPPEEREKIERAIAEAVLSATGKTADLEKAEAGAETDEVAASDPIADTTATIRPEHRQEGLRVVARASTSGGRHWGITLGAFPTRTAAEKLLLQTALADIAALDGALRKVATTGGRYHANFVGLSEENAKRACSRLEMRRQACDPVGPEG